VNIRLPFVPRGTIYFDQDDKLRLEARNGVLQTEFVLYQAQNWASDSQITPELLLELQRLAINQIYRCAGHFRDGSVMIEGVTHQPPDHLKVPELVDEMCRYVNSGWTKTPVHLASYVMWRMNWIHPFFGGNGRTARAMSYLVLCARLGFVLPGTKMIPELIMENRDAYIRALQAADAAFEAANLDVSRMEELMSSLLADQLVTIHERATGKVFDPPK
jgi:Fic family protein